MAGFGDLALAFAGGAAKQVNDDADAARDAAHKQQARAKELRLAQKLRMEETAYTKRMENWEADNIKEKKLAQAKATGDPHVFARVLAEVQGRDPNEIARQQRNGMSGNILPWERSTDKARPTVPNYMPAEAQEKTVNAAAKIARVFGVKEEELKEVPQTKAEIESGAPVRYEMPENYDWSGYLDPAEKEKLKFIEVTNPDGTKSVQAYGETSGKLVSKDTFGVGGKEEALSDIMTARKDLAALKAIKNPTQVDKDTIAALENKLKGEDKRPFVNTKKLWRPINGGVPVELIRRGNEYWLGDKQIEDISQYVPITDDTATAAAEKEIKVATDMKSGLSMIANMKSTLDQMKKSQTEGTQGLPGAAIGVMASVKRQVRGIGEFLGVPPTTTEDIEAELKKAGIDVEEFLSTNREALQGFNKDQLGNMIYMMAQVNKNEYGRRVVTEGDYKRAEQRVKALTSDKQGLGAQLSLMNSLNTIASGKFQTIYQTVGVNANTRISAGTELLRLTRPEIPLDRLTADTKTGEVFVVLPDGEEVSIDKIILNEGEYGSLRPAPLNIRPE